ncbi:hypothetical protein HK098_006050 [Nowakowskiella sp. JEL0407]|nr:hypothetical protein HK098_006050 [Nowakowskiella sp. JEL0407]
MMLFTRPSTATNRNWKKVMSWPDERASETSSSSEKTLEQQPLKMKPMAWTSARTAAISVQKMNVLRKRLLHSSSVSLARAVQTEPTVDKKYVPTFRQTVVHSDGSTFSIRTTSPRPLLRMTKDVRNSPVWNPLLKFNTSGELDGEVARFAKKFASIDVAPVVDPAPEKVLDAPVVDAKEDQPMDGVVPQDKVEVAEGKPRSRTIDFDSLTTVDSSLASPFGTGFGTSFKKRKVEEAAAEAPVAAAAGKKKKKK